MNKKHHLNHNSIPLAVRPSSVSCPLASVPAADTASARYTARTCRTAATAPRRARTQSARRSAPAAPTATPSRSPAAVCKYLCIHSPLSYIYTLKIIFKTKTLLYDNLKRHLETKFIIEFCMKLPTYMSKDKNMKLVIISARFACTIGL